jgi:hypothetical protein
MITPPRLSIRNETGQVRAADRVVKNRCNVQHRYRPMKYESVLGANGRV